jgi:Flp pilus assembly protein TadD
VSTAAAVGLDLGSRLVGCAVAGQSGIITAARGKLKRLFCVDAGILCWATSNVIEEQLGERLVARGLLAPELLAATRARCAEEGGKPARRLLDDGAVDEVTLRETLEILVRDLLWSTLDWPDGDVQFDQGTPDLTDEITVRLDPGILLFNYAMNRPRTVDDLRARVGAVGARLVVAETQRSRATGLSPAEVVAYLVGRADGTRNVNELVQSSPATPETTWRALWGLCLAGILAAPARGTLESEGFTRDEIVARFARIEGADHYSVLDLSPLATRDQIREAYYVLARRLHPDRFRSGPMADLRPRIEIYFTRVTEAYNTLFDTLSRRDYDQQRAGTSEAPTVQVTQSAETLARQNYVRAKDLIRRGRYAEAVTCLENAVKLAPRQASYHLDLGRLTADNPRLRARAEQHLRQATDIDPTCIDAYLALGELYIKTRRKNQAAHMFAEVLRWEPHHHEAKSKLAELQRQKG